MRKSGRRNCNGRREFLVKATTVAGGLALSLANLRGGVSAQAGDTDKMSKTDATQSDEIILKLDDKSPLAKVGGSQTLETKEGKVIVVRTTETNFIALSAVCPHKGGPIKYDEKTSQLFVPGTIRVSTKRALFSNRLPNSL